MSEPQIWLIGGTSESAQLAIALAEQNIPYIVTVTTTAARNLYPPTSKVWVGKMTPDAIAAFVQAHHIVGILDASHPFATEISRQAIAFVNQLANQPVNQPVNQQRPDPAAPNPTLAYLRYERSVVQADPQFNLQSNPQSNPQFNSVITVDSIEALLFSELLQHQRVLFTLGCRDLYRFSALRQTSQLFARILPSADAIAQALSAGFTPDQLIALRPPVSAALEKALWQQWNISRVVAKASGHPGGETIKRQIAQELGITLILIQRPRVSYLQQTSSLSQAVLFCQNKLKANTSKPYPHPAI